jgi:hypothetical protein
MHGGTTDFVCLLPDFLCFSTLDTDFITLRRLNRSDSPSYVHFLPVNGGSINSG